MQGADAVLAAELAQLVAHGGRAAADHDAGIDEVAEGRALHLVVQAEVAGVLQQGLDAPDVDAAGQRELLHGDRSQALAEGVLQVLAVLLLGSLVGLGDRDGLQESEPVGVARHSDLVGDLPEPVEDALAGQLRAEPAEVVEAEAAFQAHLHGVGVADAGDPRRRLACSGRGQMLTCGYW